jgi:hypothetical protein
MFYLLGNDKRRAKRPTLVAQYSSDCGELRSVTAAESTPPGTVRPCKKGGDNAVARQRGWATGLAGSDHLVGTDGMTTMCQRDRVHSGFTKLTAQLPARSALTMGSAGLQNIVIDPQHLTSF